MDKDRQSLINELTSRESGVESTSVSTREGKSGTIYSIVPYFPVRDKVVVRTVFEESIMALRDEAAIRKAEPISKTIVATGDEVDGLDIGDEVNVSFNATIEPIVFKGNKKTIKKMIAAITNTSVKFNPIEAGVKNVRMVEYYSVPLFAINGVITENGNIK